MSMQPKPPGYYTDKLFTCDDMDKAIQKEREECAEAVEGYRKQRTHETWYKAEEQIRARGQE